MASEPFETLLDPFPQTLDGVDHGEIIQKDGASRSGTKLKASRASPQTSFGPRHSIASFFSASLAKLRTPPVPTKKRSRRSELACVFYLHHLLVSAAASTRIPFAATFFFGSPEAASLRVTVAEGLSSASAIVFVHGGYIDLFNYFHLRKVARRLWPPFLRLAPKTLIRQLSLGSHGRIERVPNRPSC